LTNSAKSVYLLMRISCNKGTAVSDSTDRLQGTLRAAGRRLTAQRRLILQVLEESSGHLDADALYERVKARDPDVSLATVYRTLAVLREIGLVEEHRLGEGHGHYEAVHDEPHYHFTCLRCGKVIEFDTPLVAQIERELGEQDGVRAVSSHLLVSGYCAQCKSAAV
jgi:Fe2+ or Zn2+ uptake regulation protein